MEYLRRTVDSQLDELTQWEPATAIDGPKGVGKTVTAQGWAQAVWELDDRNQRHVLAADLTFRGAPDGYIADR